MKELFSINGKETLFPPKIPVLRPTISTISDSGYWYKPDKQNQHHIDIFWNGEDEKIKKTTEKQIISKYRHGRGTFDVKKINNGREIHIKELQKTKREKQIILDRISAVNGLVKSFGYQNSQKHDLNRAHLLKPGDLEIFSNGNIVDGFFDPYGHCISIERSPSDVETATIVGHEKLHNESPVILQKINGVISTLRMGLKTRSHDDIIHMDKIDEAVTADLNYYLYKTTIQNNPLYEKELSMVRKIKPWIKEVMFEREVGNVILSENVYPEDIYTIRGAEGVLKILNSPKSKNYKIAYMTDIIENPKEDRRLVTFERSDEMRYFTETAYKIINAAKMKGQIIYPNEIINWFSWVKFAPNDKFFEKREALKQKIDSFLGEGEFDKLK